MQDTNKPQCFLYNNCNHCNCENSFCLRKYKTEYLYKEALLPKSRWAKQVLKVDADGTDVNEFKQIVDIEANIKDFVATGRNLFLYSTNCGNGKTSSAIRLLQAYLGNVWVESELTCRALFVNTTEFLQAIKDNISGYNPYADQIKSRVRDADLVVWDDIGTKNGTEFELGILFNYINYRVFEGKSNIYTSNVLPKDLGPCLGERLVSRIVNGSLNIELHGADKRFLGRSAN